MIDKLINDITNFIFLKHIPQKSDIIVLPGSSSPELPELASDLWKSNYSDKIFISGKFSRKTGKFEDPRSKKEIYKKDYKFKVFSVLNLSYKWI